MDNLQKEIELKKLEIEKLKIKEGFIRTLSIILLTIGAGIGASLKIIDIPKLWYSYIIIMLGIIFLGIGLIFIIEVVRFKKKIKELDKWNS
ncbi:hypothetical protein [Persephonella sp. KM09-Lau-8]|uniref:hypothetical protein n=1 Tax=Persephonella sp. KM09-Lau-8 TaxID=1158345 RepID=UPI0004963E97|nr:hypothetical protein [Persephonella sp. KM09-Lau-8]